jgi:hypothetical protein
LFGLGKCADDGANVVELVEEGFEKLVDGHGVELVSEGEHALVVLGDSAAAGVVVKAAEGLSAKGGLGAGLSGGQESGAEGGRERAWVSFVAKIEKPAGWRASFVSISILENWGK